MRLGAECAACSTAPRHSLLCLHHNHTSYCCLVFFWAAGLVLINNISVELLFVATSGVAGLRWQQVVHLSDPRKLEEGRRLARNSETVAAGDFDRGWKRCNTRCRGLYLHLWRRPVGRTDAPPYLPGASHLYGEEAKELALAPVRLARQQS
jgi:hypothetical protein